MGCKVVRLRCETKGELILLKFNGSLRDVEGLRISIEVGSESSVKILKLCGVTVKEFRGMIKTVSLPD